MTKREWILTGLLLFFLGAAGYGFYKSHVDDARLAAQTQANNDTIAKYKADNATIAATAKDAVAQLETERKTKATPQNTVQTITKYVNVPQPIYVYGDPKPGDPAKPTTPGETPTLPDAPEVGSIIIPPADVPAFRDNQLTCQENSTKLDACTATNANLVAIDKTKDKQIADDHAALKGGTFWRRTWTFVKIAVPAAGAGYLIAKTAK